jgi:glycosyltransferase involved in cell wall biosynthesis
MLNIVIWMNLPSFHQEGLFKFINNSQRVNLEVIYAQDLTEDRKSIGWKRDFNSYSYKILKKFFPLALLEIIFIIWKTRKQIHIVNGIWAEPSFIFALIIIKLLKIKYIIYAEAQDPFLRRNPLKKSFQSFFGSWIVKSSFGFLAVSHLAEDFFQKLGANKNDIYPFGYFQQALKITTIFQKTEKINFVFIGQLVPRKGVDLLLNSIEPLFAEYPNLCLNIVGQGEEQETLNKLVKDRNLIKYIHFLGVMDSSKICSYIKTQDLLILPSRWDGWGMVVNEAMSVGVPVIASDKCGSSDVIKNGKNGYIFKSEDQKDLFNSLNEFLKRRSDWENFKAEAQKTGENLSAEIVTPYLIDSIEHMLNKNKPRPLPPWLNIK